ncbi:MAG: metal ABC transporter ATP-binding protein [Planctomycetaceae bacterium]|nr:metal ABC transporter ATP-binding protein [Planctomycetaceae bacterium]
MPSPSITFDAVSVTLAGVTILESITAEVPAGSATAIIGPNGAGKTTLLLALLGQVPFAGSIRVGDEPAAASAVRLGYVPQRLDFDRAMPLTVMELLSMGRQRLPLWFGVRVAHRRRAAEVLAQVKAEHLSRRRVGALSGGELQRVLLALAMLEDPQVLILDEPSSGVDIAGENLLCELLETLRAQKGFTQIMVTHDLSLVTAHASHVICLNRRVTGQGPTLEALTPEVLASTFGIHLGLANLALLHRDCCQEHHHA